MNIFNNPKYLGITLILLCLTIVARVEFESDRSGNIAIFVLILLAALSLYKSTKKTSMFRPEYTDEGQLGVQKIYNPDGTVNAKNNYLVLKHASVESLGQMVDDHIKHGYEFVGGIFIYKWNNRAMYAQSVHLPNTPENSNDNHAKA